MKTNKLILSILLNLVLMSSAFTQVPEGIKYQAVARNTEGAVLANEEVIISISIIQGSAEGTIVYNESHNTFTNKLGMVTLTIGQGETSDDFSSIDWKQSPYFINIQVNGLDLGTSQLLSVPYALYAKEAGNVLDITSSDTAKWNQAFESIADSVITYEAGEGISINDNVISVTTPDPEQPVPLKYRGGVIYVHPFLIKSSEWGINNFVTGSISETDGESNTEVIVKTLGGSAVPAKTCYDLVDFGFDDWYLPSRYEIDAIYKQSYLLKYIDYSSHYWSSTEFNKDMAWKLNFYNGTQSLDYKKNINTFICIRRDK